MDGDDGDAAWKRGVLSHPPGVRAVGDAGAKVAGGSKDAEPAVVLRRLGNVGGLEDRGDDAERSFEGYAVTAAALARRLLEYLAIDDLSVPDGFRDEPPNYPLRTVLDRILHFRVLYQDAIAFNVPGMADLFTLYSDQTQEHRDHLDIRLGDYRDTVRRLASDDRYVARHLLRRSVTFMNGVMRGSNDGMAPRELLKQARSGIGFCECSTTRGNCW